MTSITLTKGRGLLIAGPQGAGKSTHARTIAGEHGSFVAVPYSQFARDRYQGFLASEPAVLILEKAPIDPELMAIAKVILLSNELVMNLQAQARPARRVRAPHLIVTSNDSAWPTADGADLERFFDVLRFPLSFQNEA